MTRGRARRRRLAGVLLALIVALTACSGTAAPLLPTATTSPSAIPTATGSLQLGFSAGELVGLTSDEINAQLDRYQAAGGSVIRFDLNWSLIQAGGPDSWDWSDADLVVRAIYDRHLTALAILDYTPSWARPAGCTSPGCGPADPAAFAAFAQVAVGRYAQGVHLWEIWNEENTGWLPAPNPTAYADLLAKTTAAVHVSQPSATVMVGGLAPARTAPGGSYSPPDFVSELYRIGLPSSVAGVAMHPYSYPALPGEPSAGDGWSQMLDVHAVMTAHGDGAKSMWATEFGAPTAGPGAIATYADRRYALQPDHVDLDLQARSVDAAVAAGRQLPWLRMLLWYGIEDLGSDPQSSLMSFGLLYPDGSPKPAYARWQAAVRSLYG